jgi:hypothetical protein
MFDRTRSAKFPDDANGYLWQNLNGSFLIVPGMFTFMLAVLYLTVLSMSTSEIIAMHA